eukprot:gene23120-31437_t
MQAGLESGGYIEKLSSDTGICSYSASCSNGGYEGVCVSISSGCCDGGTVASGLCPGSDDIKCCTTPSCSTPSGTGSCKAISQCSGTSVPGYCTGPSELQCCIPSSSSCSTPSGTGTCISTSSCASSGGTSIAGYCPGASDNQCCVQGLSSCSTPTGSGTCMSTSSCSSSGGLSIPGYCPGESDNQCCVQGIVTGSGKGFDISTTLTASAASCYVSSGYTNVIPRGYQSLGYVDTQVCTSLINAYNAGMKVRDVYLFPCPTCSKSAATQMSELVSYLHTNCKVQWSGRVWLDIEGSQYWLGSTSSNQAWYKQLKDSCYTYGVSCGVYSSTYQWSSIFGSTSFVYGSELPLWYAHYDNIASFYDFTAFGGWSTPYAKQFGGGTTCSTSADYNYSPYY